MSIGAVVPLFSFPQNGKASSTARWSLREYIGQSAVLFLLPGSGAPPLDAIAMQSLNQIAHQLRFKQVAAALVLPVAAPTSARLIAVHAPISQLPLLTDKTGSLRLLFNLDARATALVSIDRAGFLRGVQVLSAGNGTNRWGAMTRVLAESSDPTPAIIEGRPAPDFTVRDMNGKVQRLRDYRGRNLLLTFFPRCFTGGCVSHLSSLRDYKAQLDATGTRVLAVSVDAAAGPKGQKAFAAELKLPFPLIPDMGRNLSILYGAAHSPDQLASRMSVLIDKDGTVRWIDRGIDVRTHGADVLVKIKSLGLNPPLAP